MPKRTTPSEYVARHITDAMKTAGVSLRGLADTTGIPASSLSRYLRAQTSPTLDHLARIADALGAVPADFVPGRDAA